MTDFVSTVDIVIFVLNMLCFKNFIYIFSFSSLYSTPLFPSPSSPLSSSLLLLPLSLFPSPSSLLHPPLFLFPSPSSLLPLPFSLYPPPSSPLPLPSPHILSLHANLAPGVPMSLAPSWTQEERCGIKDSPHKLHNMRKIASVTPVACNNSQ